MLNKNIKIDLHIHSVASEYKESKEDGISIVANSTKENLCILLNKLLENNVSLFSITDHNRFDSALYEEIENQLKEERYKNKLNFLCGVEFDVRLEEDKKPAHIITIFDAKTLQERKRIENKINEKLLSHVDDSYEKNDYENLLKNIGLSTILIIHQKCSLDVKKGNHKSLSEACSDPYKMIKIGYFDALEFQKPNVEGILLDNLSKIDTNISLITGSDCHDWEVYPLHDKSICSSEHYYSTIKSLPTFKGLLMALTSIETRFNRVEKLNTNYLPCFTVLGKNINLDPGINVIIGENGSGKSTLLNIFANNVKESYVKNIKRENDIVVDCSHNNIEYISQAQIVNLYHEGKLFQGDMYFDAINNADFESEYKEFSRNLKMAIESNIDKKSKRNKLNSQNFVPKPDKEEQTTYYITVNKNDLYIKNNVHKDRLDALNALHLNLLKEYNNNYYSNDEKEILKNAIDEIEKLIEVVERKYFSIDIENKIKNIITSESENYNIEINNLSTAADKEIRSYNESKNEFVEEIVSCIKQECVKLPKLELQKSFNGSSVRRFNGFVFANVAAYDGENYLDQFLKTMFVRDCRSIEKLLQINNRNQLQTALYGCTNVNDIDSVWNTNLNKFLTDSEKTKRFIQEENSTDTIGNTLGEVSLAYYKFQTSANKDCDILMIDQPEDNISNIKIANKLVSYLNNLREKRQMIIVTHNPLLVVNLDADNVVYVNNVNGKLQIESGCLEYVSDNGVIITDLVADTLDGGKEMIQKRLKIYV